MIFSKKMVQFIAVAKHGSIIKASSELNSTPSAISQGVNNLESIVGRKLLFKTRSGMSLTDAGKCFYTQIKSYYDEANKIFENIKAHSDKNLCIKIDGFHYPQIQYNLHEFLMENENIIINILCDIVTDIQGELIIGESDIIISPLNLDVTDSRIQKISLPSERLGVFLNKKVIDKYKGNINKALQNEKFIHIQSVLRHSAITSIINKLKSYRLTKKIMIMNEINTLHLLSKGIGFTLSTESFAHFHSNKNDQLFFVEKPFGQDFFLNRKAYFLKDSFKNPYDVLNSIIIK